MDLHPEQEGQQDSKPRSYWSRWSKQDFFPEYTFQNFHSYKDALSHTPSRLKDRLLHRSSDSFELLQLPKQSENLMKRCLTWWDLIWLGFGAVVGSGIFVITGQATRDDAGPAIVLSYAVSGLSAMLSVLCYTEFAVEVPVAGGSFSYLRIELGDFVAFIAAGNILLEALVGSAGLGRSWSSYFASIFRTDDTDFLRIRKYTQIDRDAAYSVAFEAIGMNWAKYIVSICALKGMTTSLLVGSMGQARNYNDLEYRDARVGLVCSVFCDLVSGDFVDGIASKAPGS